MDAMKDMKKIGFWRWINAYSLLLGGYPWEYVRLIEEQGRIWHS
jgi:hypothetical protein